MKRNLAVILARKNSRRLKNKHLVTVGGKPLIQYTFEYAKASRALNDIVCSTDSEEITRLAGAFGIDVIKRPSRLAMDGSHIIDSIEHALLQYEAGKGFLPEVTVILYGNVPLHGTSIEKGLRFFYRKKADAVFTACGVSKYHPEWMFKTDGSNRIILDRKSRNYRCQDLPGYYLATDSFIIAKTERILKRPARKNLYSDFGDNIFFVEEKQNATIDVDDAEDLDYFRFILNKRKRRYEKEKIR